MNAFRCLLWSILIISGITLRPAVAVEALETKVLPPPTVLFTISCDKRNYISGEQITVTCTLKNIGKAPIKVLEPTPWAGAIRFYYETGEGHSKVEWGARPRFQGLERTMSGRRLALNPGESVTESSELFDDLFSDYRLLPQGNYKLRAYYHYADIYLTTIDSTSPKPNYLINNIESNTTGFSIVRASKEDRAVQAELQWFADHRPYAAEFRDTMGYDVAEKFREPFFSQTALRTTLLLVILDYSSKKMSLADKLKLIRRIQGEKFSTYGRQKLLDAEAYALEDAGDLEGALRVLQSATLYPALAHKIRVENEIRWAKKKQPAP